MNMNLAMLIHIYPTLLNYQLYASVSRACSKGRLTVQPHFFILIVETAPCGYYYLVQLLPHV